MRLSEKPIRNSLLLALVLIAAVLLPSSGSAEPSEMHTETWVETPEAQVRTALGECPEGLKCYQLCVNLGNGPMPIDTWSCRP